MSDKPIAWLVVSKEGVPVTGESGDLIGCYDHNDLLPGDDYREKRGEHVVAVYTLPPLHQLAPRVVAAWLDARRERMYSGDSETEKIANTTLEFAAHDLRRTSGLSPVVDPPAPAPTEPAAFWCESHNEFRLAGCNCHARCSKNNALLSRELDTVEKQRDSALAEVERLTQEKRDVLLEYIDRADRVTGLKARLSAVEGAAAPLVHFINQMDRKPIGMMHDIIYAVHSGTEWEAEIRGSVLRALRAALGEEPPDA